MSAWLSLLKKEYRLTKSFILGGLFLLMVVGFLEVYLAYRYYYGVLILPTTLIILPHLLYMAVYMLRSLSKEWNHTAQLWLHLPQSGRTLLSAKLVSSFMAMAVSLSIALTFTFWVTTIVISRDIPLQSAPLNWDIIALYGLYFAVFLLLTGLYLGLWAMMISVTAASVKRFINRGCWLVGIAVFFAASWLIDAFQTTTLYEQLTHWGAVHLPLSNVTPISNVPENLAAYQVPIYLGEAAFYLLIMAGLFFLSGWLLDNKVEV